MSSWLIWAQASDRQLAKDNLTLSKGLIEWSDHRTCCLPLDWGSEDRGAAPEGRFSATGLDRQGCRSHGKGQDLAAGPRKSRLSREDPD